MYRKTGNNISVSVDDLKNIIIDKLRIYDNTIPRARTNMVNPYKNVIYTKTKEGKMIQIPSDIQETIINQWIQSKQTHNNNNIYNNELDKLRQYEASKNDDNSVRGALPRDYELYNREQETQIQNVEGVFDIKQEHETHDFQEPPDVQQYINNEKVEECLTCNTNTDYEQEYIESSRHQTPYIDTMNNGDDIENDIDDDIYFIDNDDMNIYKYLFYITLIVFLFVLYRFRNNNNQIFNL
jgi:hypothetical protein